MAPPKQPDAASKEADKEFRVPAMAAWAGRMYDRFGPVIEKMTANIAQEWERFAYGRNTSHTYGIHGAPDSPIHGKSHSPDQHDPTKSVPDTMGRTFGEETLGHDERQTTAEVAAHLKAVGAENALHDLHQTQSHHPYSFHDAPDRESRSGAQEAMDARTAGVAAGERDQAMRDAYLGFDPGGGVHGPGDGEIDR